MRSCVQDVSLESSFDYFISDGSPIRSRAAPMGESQMDLLEISQDYRYKKENDVQTKYRLYGRIVEVA